MMKWFAVISIVLMMILGFMGFRMLTHSQRQMADVVEEEDFSPTSPSQDSEESLVEDESEQEEAQDTDTEERPVKEVPPISGERALPQKEKSGPTALEVIKNMTPSGLQEMQDYYIELEKKWDGIVKNLIVNEFSLTESEYQDYQNIREDFQRERARTFQDFHEEMLAKHGEGHVYNPTEYEDHIGKEVQKEYLSRLKRTFGDKNFFRYLREKDGFNEKAKRNRDPRKGLLKIYL